MRKGFICLLLLSIFGFEAMAASNDSLDVFYKRIDSIYVELHYQHQNKDRAAIEESVAAIDALVAPLEQQHPFICGLVQLHQAYYAGNATASEPYLQRGLANLNGANAEFAENYSGSFLWLFEGFSLENRLEEWAPVDNLFRKILDSQHENSDPKFAVIRSAVKALQEKNYPMVDALAKYDEYYFQQLTGSRDKFYLVYLKWLQVKQQLDQWMALPYSERSLTRYNFNPGQVIPDYLKSELPDHSVLRNFDYKTSLKGLLEELEALEPELLVNNIRLSGNYNELGRIEYFTLYEYLLQDLYMWAVNEHRQSEVILPIKRFFSEVLPGELEDARAAGKPSLISSSSSIQLIKNLAQLFYDVGNAEQSHYVIMRGLELMEISYSQNEILTALVELAPLQIRTRRLAGDLDAALEKNVILKKVTDKPDSLTSENSQLFEDYAEARVEEVYTLMAQQKREKAIDSLSFLLDELGTIKMESEEVLYETEIWPHLQYLTATVLAQKGRYNTGMITEMVADLLSGQITSEIFYPGQLFALKAKWHETGELDLDYFQNLLFYTERQLQHNFIFLTAEERMQLYAHRLNDIFDVYHQLLFEGELDKYPELKQKVISQSLYLKNALADGNLIPDEFFFKGNDYLDKDFLDQVRALKQETKLSQQVQKLHKIDTEVSGVNDQIQTMWLELLEGGMEDLVKLEGIEGISRKLKPGELYLESIRYTRSLSDSTAVYAAYLIGPEDFTYLNICSESALLELLEQKNSSAQTQSLTSSAERGGIGVSLKPAEGSFKPGDTDLLGQTLLAPLWPYLEGNSALLMVHDGLLNRISFAALQWDQKYLMDHFRLRHFSGSKAVGLEASSPAPESKVLLAGGLDYGQQDVKNPELLFKPGVVWDYLPGTKSEIEMLQPIFSEAGYTPKMVSGQALSDSLSRDLGQYHFVHLATHGFYLDSNSADQLFDPLLNRDAMALEPLFRSGLAISRANNPPAAKTLNTQGFLMGYELANMDLRNCYLVSLSACETGLGDLRNNLGVDGLPRALKIAGAKNLLISLWKVPDAPTAEFMKRFYTNLFSGKLPAVALQDTQREMSSSYPASAWGAFILVE